jgi:hypothetical protein
MNSNMLELEKRVDEIAEEAYRSCGRYYEIYLQRLKEQLHEFVTELGTGEREQVAEYAFRQYDVNLVRAEQSNRRDLSAAAGKP